MKKSLFVLIPLPFLLFACAGLSGILPKASPDLPDEMRDWAANFTPGDPTATPHGEDITDPDYIKGKEAYWKDEYEETIRLMTLVLERDPNLAPAYWYRSMATAYLGRYQEAMPDMEKALEIDPYYALAYADRGYLYANMGDLNRAIRDYERAISIDPSLAKTQQNIAFYYYHQGDYLAAVEQYQLALKTDPTRASAWLAIGALYGELGMFEECIVCLSNSIDLLSGDYQGPDEPDPWLSYSHRGYCRHSLGQHEAAVTDLDIYLENVQDDMHGWNNRGSAHFDLGNYDQALKDFDQAIAIDPSHPHPYLNKGILYIHLDDFESAIEYFTYSLSLAEVPRAYVGRGEAYVRMGLYNEAIPDLQRAIQLIPNYEDAHAYLGWALLELGQYKEALDHIEKSIRLGAEGSNLKVAIEMRGRAYYGLGQYEKALIDLNTAMEMEPTVIGFYYEGLVYQALGNYLDAETSFEAFLFYGGADNQGLIDEVDQRLEEIRKHIDE